MGEPGGIGCDRAVVDALQSQVAALQDQVAVDTAIIRAKNAEIERLRAEVSDLKHDIGRQIQINTDLINEYEGYRVALEEIVSEQYGGDKCELVARQALKQSEQVTTIP